MNGQELITNVEDMISKGMTDEEILNGVLKNERNTKSVLQEISPL